MLDVRFSVRNLALFFKLLKEEKRITVKWRLCARNKTKAENSGQRSVHSTLHKGCLWLHAVCRLLRYAPHPPCTARCPLRAAQYRGSVPTPECLHSLRNGRTKSCPRDQQLPLDASRPRPACWSPSIALLRAAVFVLLPSHHLISWTYHPGLQLTLPTWAALKGQRD